LLSRVNKKIIPSASGQLPAVAESFKVRDFMTSLPWTVIKPLALFTWLAKLFFNAQRKPLPLLPEVLFLLLLHPWKFVRQFTGQVRKR